MTEDMARTVREKKKESRGAKKYMHSKYIYFCSDTTDDKHQ